MHWCADETFMLMSMIPSIGMLFHRLHTWYHVKFGHKCHEKTCDKKHIEHCYVLPNIPHGKVGEGQCEQHPLENNK